MRTFLFLTLIPSLLWGSNDPKALFHGLDPYSITQAIAFYELYPNTNEGQKALQRALQLLSTDQNLNPLSGLNLKSLFPLLIGTKKEEGLILDPIVYQTIESIASHLPHRGLKGHHIWEFEELLKLEADDVDLARGLFLSLYKDHPDKIELIRSYEALIDLMALQIKARLTPSSTPREKIRAINHALFVEAHLRFPPHSLWANDIDLYTFLPSVLDSRRGVCLGVSTLYLCLGQRLNLPLEIITPPGHIYVRYNDGQKVINIETTARGVHIPSEEYLSLNIHTLPKRTIKQVIGLNYFNQASALWQRNRLKEALEAYQNAHLFMPNDPLNLELLGYLYLLNDQKKEGLKVLKPLVNYHEPHNTSPNSLVEDLVKKRCDAHAIAAIFKHVDENRDSILAKQTELESVLKKYPKFKAGYFALAITYLQLGRQKEALPILQDYLKLEPQDPVALYYASAIYLERFDYKKAWEFLDQTTEVLSAFDYYPQALKGLKQELKRVYPTGPKELGA